MIPPFRREFDAAWDPKTALNALGFARGAWTPTLTFATPGDLSVVYSARTGLYLKQYDLIQVWFRIVTSTFTHTTASGSLTITGLPYIALSSPTMNYRGEMTWQGITKANYTHVVPTIGTGANSITLAASGSAQTLAAIVAADTPTGGTMNLQGHICYQM